MPPDLAVRYDTRMIDWLTDFAHTPLGVVGLTFVFLCMGSFLNVLIYRLPRGLSPWLARSRCPHCDAILRAQHLIPVVSYVILRGRCAYCKGSISVRYPLGELTTTLLLWIGVILL